ncbi:MAG: radical SAM protein, partial [Hungatella sp.]
MRQPLELYIHIPFCAEKCAYCDFLSAPAHERVRHAYVEQLIEEIRMQSASYEQYGVTTVFIGGGTPSVLQEEDMAQILAQLHACFAIDPKAEITIEINPGTVNAGKLAVYQAGGINRISIGLQSADDRELKTLGRIHTYDEFLKTYERVRIAGFTNVSVDL